MGWEIGWDERGDWMSGDLVGWERGLNGWRLDGMGEGIGWVDIWWDG